jgi:DNA segregation ATPase FtsK/SpoIIIE-like protein
MIDVVETIPLSDGRTWLKFNIDMQRLPFGIRSLDLKNEATIVGLTDACASLTGGTPIVLAQGSGVSYLTWLHKVETAKPQSKLPKRVDLDLSLRPDGQFMLPIGQGYDGLIWKCAAEVGHFLIGGTTRSGKSTLLHSMIASCVVCDNAPTLRLGLIDTKGSELSEWGGAPQLIKPIACNVSNADDLLAEVVAEMDRRGQMFGEIPGARTFTKFNTLASQTGREKLPLILLIVDEFVDLILQARSDGNKTLEVMLSRLASKGSGLGITLILTTTDPTAEVVDMKIRRCCTYRMCFSVPTASDSEIILGVRGAEKIPHNAKGRMFFGDETRRVVEVQGFFLSDEALGKIQESFPLRDDNANKSIALDPLALSLARFAEECLGGEFAIKRLFEDYNRGKPEQAHVPKHIIASIGKQLEEQQLLRLGAKPSNPRIRVRLVTDELRALCQQAEENAIKAETSQS